VVKEKRAKGRKTAAMCKEEYRQAERGIHRVMAKNTAKSNSRGVIEKER